MSSSSTSHDNCGHWFVRHSICLSCKKKPSHVQGRRFDYLFTGLLLSHEAVSYTKRLTTLISLHRHKKLHLVLDLDHTLLHSVKVSDLTETEKYLMEIKISGSKRNLRRHNDRIIKFRPFLDEFLIEANKLFNMYVYTKGTFEYGQAVVNMIDPEKTYFGDRVITRQESPNDKTLDLVLADERGILIVDDTSSVWPHHKRNLLHINKYFYFKHDCVRKDSKLSLAERNKDESGKRGMLVNLLKFLEEIHSGFFSLGLEEELDSKDVRFLINGPFTPQGCCTTRKISYSHGRIRGYNVKSVAIRS